MSPELIRKARNTTMSARLSSRPLLQRRVSTNFLHLNKWSTTQDTVSIEFSTKRASESMWSWLLENHRFAKGTDGKASASTPKFCQTPSHPSRHRGCRRQQFSSLPEHPLQRALKRPVKNRVMDIHRSGTKPSQRW